MPEPDAPTMPMRSPGRIVSETSCSAGAPPLVAEARRGRARSRRGRRPPRRRPGASATRGLQVEQLEHALGAGAGLLRRGQQAGHQAHRRDDLHEVAGEGEEHAERDVAAQREPAAESRARRAGPASAAPAASRSSGRCSGPCACGTGRARGPRSVSRSNSRCSWANALTTRTPVTASSTTPATRARRGAGRSSSPGTPGRGSARRRT